MAGSSGGGRGPLDPFECVLCLVHGRLQQVAGRLDLEARVLGHLAGLVARWRSRTEVFVESYEYLERLLGRDIYEERRRRLNEAALGLLDKLGLRGRSASSLVELMAAANGVDIAMPGYRPSMDKVFRGLGEQPTWLGAGPGDVEALAGGVESLVVVLDNAGEAVIDIAAAAELARRLGASRLYLVARSMPYEVDVTAREASVLASRLAPGALVVGTGGRYPVFYPYSSDEARRLLRLPRSLVLVKGIANLEAFMDYPGSLGEDVRALFLLRAKCGPLSRFFGVAFAEPVAASAPWVLERLRSWRGSGSKELGDGVD